MGEAPGRQFPQGNSAVVVWHGVIKKEARQTDCTRGIFFGRKISGTHMDYGRPGLEKHFLKNFVFWLASKPFTTLKDTNDKCLVIIFIYWNVYYNDFMQGPSLIKP